MRLPWAALLLFASAVAFLIKGASAEEDLGSNPCDHHQHDDRSMNCDVWLNYSTQYYYWNGGASTFSSPRTKIRTKSWGVEICNTQLGNFDWMENNIVDNTTYVRARGSGTLMMDCLPEASLISASFHYAKEVHDHTGSKSYRHPFRAIED